MQFYQVPMCNIKDPHSIWLGAFVQFRKKSWKYVLMSFVYKVCLLNINKLS